MVDPEVLAVFAEEAVEILEKLQRSLEAAEGAPTGDARQKPWSEVHRLAHALKGSAAMVERSDVANLARSMEHAVDAMMKSGLTPSRRFTDAIKDSMRVLNQLNSRQLSVEEVTTHSHKLKTTATLKPLLAAAS